MGGGERSNAGGGGALRSPLRESGKIRINILLLKILSKFCCSCDFVCTFLLHTSKQSYD